MASSALPRASTTWPASVRVKRLPVRSSSTRSSDCSSWAIILLTVGWVTCNCSAARLKPWWSTTATKYRKERKSMIYSSKE